MSKRKEINDPKLFREMSEPHESPEKAGEALKGFYEDVRAAREKHRIRNVMIVGEVSMIIDSEQTQAMSYQTCGEITAAEMLAAYAMGYAKREREMLIAKAQAHGAKGD